MRTISFMVIASMVLCLALVAPAFGVILHNDNEPTDRPHDDVIGRWGGSGSCVAIAPNYVVLMQHQNGGVGTSVAIGGNTYTVAQTWGHSSADIRIARLTGANLANYVNLYTGTDEIGKDFVLGGFGKSRGADLVTGGDVTYGYEWLETYNYETQQRWGTNHVDGANVGYPVSVGGTSYSSDALRADFDESGTAYEAAPADWDSGGGWFIKVGDEWQLAALSAYVDHDGETWFDDPNTGWTTDPDKLRGIRISSYDTWINETIPEPGTMTLLALGAIGLFVRRRRR